MPRRALHQLVRRLLAVVRAHGAVAPAGAPEPLRETVAHGLPVGREGSAVVHRGRRVFEQPLLGEVPLLAGVAECGAEPEEMEAELANRSVAVGGARLEMLGRHLAESALSRGEDQVEPLGEGLRGEPRTLGVCDIDQLGQRLRVPAVHPAIAEHGRRHERNA